MPLGKGHKEPAAPQEVLLQAPAGNPRPRYSNSRNSSREDLRSSSATPDAAAPIHAMFASSNGPRPLPQPGAMASTQDPSPVVHAISTADYRPESEYDNPRESRYDDVYSEGRSSYAGNGHPSNLSPPDDDRLSNESGSGGSSTKIGSPSDSRTPSAYNQAAAGRYDEPASAHHWTRDAVGPPSDSSHDNINGGMYSSSSYNASGYMDHQPLYGQHPSSPSSAQSHSSMAGFGHRYNNNGSAGIPYNSSRTALNQDWRSSADLDAIAVAPGKEMYGSPKDLPFPPTSGAGGPNAYASEKDGPTYVPIPPSSPALGSPLNEKSGAPQVGPDGARQPEPAVVLSRANRLAWIDGLRGLASIVIFVHHYADLTWTGQFPLVMQWGTVYSIMRNGQMAVAMYFLLGGRVLAHSFLRSAYQRPKVPKDSHGDPIPGAVAPKWNGPKWLSVSSSLFRRSIRLALPAIAVGFMQWQLSAHQYFDDAMQAQSILETDALWIPNWYHIGNFTNFLRFCIDLFTNANHQYMLFLGSALWTTYDQFWGSILTYIVAVMMAPLAPRGRYITYFIVLFSLFWMSAPNFLYIYGLFLADLHAGGYIRRLQNHWKPTVAIEIAVMALGTFLIAGGRNNQFGADDFFGRWTLYEGKYSYDPRQVWPQYMNFSYWCQAVCIITWVELSHVMQWFCSWGIFVWLGKISYGFYLMQFITIYALMPPLIIHFNNQNHSFWGMVTPTFIICLMANIFFAWIAYHVFDRTGLKLGKWIWDGLFVTKPKNAAALPLKMVRAFFGLIVHGPGNLWRSVQKGSANKKSSIKRGWWLLWNWRTPVKRIPIPDPTDPDILSQLHSTRWTSDMSHDREAMRTHRLLAWQQFAWIPHLFIIPGFVFVWTWFHPTGNWTTAPLTFSTLWRFVWILSFPNCLFAFFGFITPDWAPPKKVMDKKPVTREYIRNFFILLVTKGSNESAVRRGYNKLLPLEKYHPSVKVIVLTDEPYVYPDLKNIVCPKNYKSPLGKAKYKARALDYFRYHVSLGTYDWILHMDEESTCDGETLRRCIDFVRYTPHHFGQGIILYNGEGYWDNWLFTVADGIRVGDDLARFHLMNTVFQRPIFGVHGSFLLTNGEMENECTWDFGSLAEDFEFSQDAWRRGFTCGRVHGIVREQSPQTVRDFLKQRRRWFMGIRDIKGMYGLPHLAINLWTVGVFTLAVTIINIPFMAIDKSLTPLWIAIMANFCFGAFETIYIWGLFFQELDYGQKWWKIIIHLPCAIVLQPFAAILEGLSAIWAMSSEDFGKFEVIAKK